jgi:hypothetical protein
MVDSNAVVGGTRCLCYQATLLEKLSFSATYPILATTSTTMDLFTIYPPSDAPLCRLLDVGVEQKRGRRLIVLCNVSVQASLYT